MNKMKNTFRTNTQNPQDKRLALYCRDASKEHPGMLKKTAQTRIVRPQKIPCRRA